MNRQVQALAQQLLVRAAETAQPPLLSAEQGQRAGRLAWQRVGQGAPLATWLAERAALAWPSLAGSLPLDGPAARGLVAWPWCLALALLAAGVGLLAPGLGPDGRLNLLAPPLWGLLAWNLVVYVGLLLWPRRRAAAPAASPGPLRRALQRGLEAWLGRGGSAAQRPLHTRATAELLALLQPAMSSLLAAGLHLAAASLALGGVAGLYLRGLATAYQAGWDSTFLSASQARAVLAFWLGPASAATGLPLPDVAHLARLQLSTGAGEPAAAWVHLLAVTLLAAVVLPRLLLAGWAGWRARRALAGLALPLDDAYGSSLRRAWLQAQAHTPGAGVRLWVQPLQFNLAPAQAAGLLAAMTEQLPRPWLLHLAPALPVGEEPAPGTVAGWRDAERQPPQALVLLASLTATPERETHGRCVSALLAQARAAGLSGPAADPRSGASAPIWLLLEAAAFTRRFGAARRAEREAAWREWAAGLPLRLVVVELPHAS
jgi:Protein of unknown function (DUF2868)